MEVPDSNKQANAIRSIDNRRGIVYTSFATGFVRDSVWRWLVGAFVPTGFLCMMGIMKNAPACMLYMLPGQVNGLSHKEGSGSFSHKGVIETNRKTVVL